MSPWFLLPLAAILLAFAWYLRLRWKPAYALRLTLLTLALLASTFSPRPLTSPAPVPPRQILILDQSDSLTPEARTASLAQAKTWQTAEANRLVILTGTQPEPVTGEDWPTVNGRATNLAGALTLATGLLGNAPGQIILATDGRATDSLATHSALSQLSTEHSELTIQFVPLESFAPANDLYVGSIYAPSSMWQGLSFQAIIPIYTPHAGEATLQIFQNGEPVAEETILLPQGLTLQPLNLQATTPEILTLAATVTYPDDPRPENNTAYAALRIYPAPRVLIVTENPALAAPFATATGLETDVLPPDQLPSLTDLEPYQVILLHNFLATRLTEAQMRTLQAFTAQLGRGLIFIGGHNAYTLGGYQDTLLEPLLPVRLEPPPRPQNDALTFVLAFDRSSSMGRNPGTVNDRNKIPLNLAREAALRAIDTLGPDDYLGLLAFSDSADWIIPLGPADIGKTRALDALTQVAASGGTSIYNALTTAINGLLATPTTETRHLLLLSDGQSADGTLEEFLTLAQFAHAQGLTLSTIALGPEADQELMTLLAEAGGGRFYSVLQPTDLPQILVDESQAARGDNLVEGLIRPVANDNEPNHPILSGFRTGLMPSLTGYNALKSKAEQGAEDVLLSADFHDPLLSVWQYGLGRVAAWTSDLDDEWTTEWATWDDHGRFWAQIILYALPDPSLGPGQVEIEVQETVHLTAQLLGSSLPQTPTGLPLNGLEVRYTYLDAEGNVQTYPMSQTAPGLYELTLPRPAEGVYRGVVNYKPDGAQTRIEIAAPLVINYPTEWQPISAGGSANAQTESSLAQWLTTTGGTITNWETLNAPPPPVPPAPPTPQQILSRFLLALLLLWPVEIAARRKWMPWR
ncbi:MAG: VWA domain-containing protein [Anaerolineales bacterium]|nr:VWA domain-containing protein [Anaerolineales bacterium]